MAEGEEINDGETEAQDTGLAEASDYSWAPESFVADGKLDTDAFRAKYDELVTFKTEAEEKAAGLPESPDAYTLVLPEDLELPEDVTMPEGFKIEIDMTSPDLASFRDLAHKHGFSQDAVNDLMKLDAVRRLREVGDADKSADEFRDAEIAKVGKERVDKIEMAVKKRLPDAQHEAVLNSLFTADALKGLEALMSTGTRAPGGPGGGKPDFSEMSVDQRIEQGLALRREKAA